MGLWGDQAIFDGTRSFKMLDLYIETLQGTTFELRVSPLDTISDVKARIYKHEGIPISQQHLLFNSVELDDDYSLQDYDIQDGNTIKLIPQMRVGPINTRRIHIEEPSLRDYADYFTEANQDEFYDKISSNSRPLTVIVYQNGDQINLYRIVDRDATSPLSESFSNGSMYGIGDEDEDDPEIVKEKQEETDKLREKMKLLKLKMDAQNMEKKPKPRKQLPRPPSSGRTSGKSRFRRVPSSASRKLFNKNSCLPPVGFSPAGTNINLMKNSTSNNASSNLISASNNNGATTSTSSLIGREISKTEILTTADNTKEAVSSEETDSVAPLASGQTAGDLNSLTTNGEVTASNSLPGSARRKLESESAKLFRLSSVKEDEPIIDNANPIQPSPPPNPALEAILKKAQATVTKSPKKWEISQDVLLKDGPKPPSSPKKEVTAATAVTYSYKDPTVGRKSRSSKGIDRFLSEPGEVHGSRPTTSTLEALKETLGRPTTSSKRTTVSSKGGVILESLNESEVRAMSGMLSSYVRSSSRASRNGFSKDGRIPTPESRLVSARFRLSANRDGHVTPHRHLPPVKQKKKSVKRCYLCNKKTGLATSYSCRCGYNFCSIHRYAESHDCTFDYKAEGRKLLEQSNPVVTAPKLPKI